MNKENDAEWTTGLGMAFIARSSSILQQPAATVPPLAVVEAAQSVSGLEFVSESLLNEDASSF
jgi:hypothetical protein